MVKCMVHRRKRCTITLCELARNRNISPVHKIKKKKPKGTSPSTCTQSTIFRTGCASNGTGEEVLWTVSEIAACKSFYVSRSRIFNKMSSKSLMKVLSVALPILNVNWIEVEYITVIVVVLEMTWLLPPYLFLAIMVIALLHLQLSDSGCIELPCSIPLPICSWDVSFVDFFIPYPSVSSSTFT